jgi:hypothetical protein
MATGAAKGSRAKGNITVRPAAIQDALIRYYAHRQSWEDLDVALPQLVHEASDGPMIGMFGLMMGIPSNRIQIVDRSGRVLADSAGELGGSPFRSTNNLTGSAHRSRQW